MTGRGVRLVALAAAVVVSWSATVLAQDAPVLTVQVFHLEHVPVRDAAMAVQSRLSDEGSLTVRPAARSLTVEDHAENVATIATIIEELDRKPIRFRVRVEVLEGSDAVYSVPSLAEVTDRLRKVFPFNSYRRVGVAEFAGEAGDSGVLALDDGVRVQLTVNASRLDNLHFGIPDTKARLDLQPLVVERIGAKGTTSELLRSRVVLASGQEALIGAGRSETGASGIVVIVTAVEVSES